MNRTEKITRISKYVLLLGGTCFCICLVFLLMTYRSAVNRLDREYETNVFPKLADMVDAEIRLFFEPTIKGLILLSASFDWQEVLARAADDPAWLQSNMKIWARAFDVKSVAISDRYRRMVWDYWTEKPIRIEWGNPRDAWFFEFWSKKRSSDWTFNLYADEDGSDYTLYLDRIVRGKNGNPVGSIAAQIPLSQLRDRLISEIRDGERLVILDGDERAIIDISHMRVVEKVRVFDRTSSRVGNEDAREDPLLQKVLSSVGMSGRVRDGDMNVIYKKAFINDGPMSVLALMDTTVLKKSEKARLIREVSGMFVLFTLFTGGMLFAMVFFTRRLKNLAMLVDSEKKKLEDLLFILTHGIGNEILLLQKGLSLSSREVAARADFRLSEMTLMVQNSVNAARLGGGKKFIISKPYPFAWQWDKLESSFRPMAESKGQTFHMSQAPSCVIRSDEEMMYQVLVNLVSNAVKYSPPGGQITLNAADSGSSLSITISDSGPGFSEKDRKKLFSKFGKLSAKPTGGERSTGLGLYIVKELSAACGARLSLLPAEEGCGARWKIEIDTVQSGM